MHLLQKQSFRRVLKKSALKNFTKLTGKHLCQNRVQDFCEISKNSFSYRTPPVVASVVTIVLFRSNRSQTFYKTGF